jgi:hypothetical protein
MKWNHDLFQLIFYRVIMIFEKYDNIGLVLDFLSIFLLYY